MKIKPVQNFAHAPSKRAFMIGHIHEVTEKSAAEFIKAGLAVAVEEDKKPKPKAD